MRRFTNKLRNLFQRDHRPMASTEDNPRIDPHDSQRFSIKLKRLFHSKRKPIQSPHHQSPEYKTPNGMTKYRLQDLTLPHVPFEHEPNKPLAWHTSRPHTPEGTILNQWNQAPTWSALLDLNRAFLRGQSPTTPYAHLLHLSDMPPCIPSILPLHAYGLLTLSAQPSSSGSPVYGLCRPVQDRVQEYAWEQDQLRSFLTFIVPARPDNPALTGGQVSAFLEILLTHPEVHAHVMTSEGAWDQLDRPCGRVEVEVRSSFPVFWGMHVARVAKEKDDIEAAEVRHLRCFSLEDHKPLWWLSCDAFEKNEPVLVRVLARRLEEGDLIGLVGEAARRAGMGVVFGEGG
ncbi:hypothetical protein TI39_contig694g00003 [Zymoseptoria brevis]|uniref:Uncharacterized protein n=1 Tax=Zymoseptoria brevis TaxID=1047168 RepID=A0A0F4GGT3_9PEZI|nr:hypothetical protein TI39_contig694g00003 [Zymoseptoria brevis]